MSSVNNFITAIVFCRNCDNQSKCDDNIDCPWLSPHDEANCSKQCSSCNVPCDCNKPGNMTCEGRGGVCYPKSCKFQVLFCFRKRLNHLFKS